MHLYISICHTNIFLFNYHMVGTYFEVLKFHEWSIPSLSQFYFHKWVWQNGQLFGAIIFQKGLNFTNDQHPQNSQNLHTSKKPTIQYLCMYVGTLYQSTVQLVNSYGYNVRTVRLYILMYLNLAIYYCHLANKFLVDWVSYFIA